MKSKKYTNQEYSIIKVYLKTIYDEYTQQKDVFNEVNDEEQDFEESESDFESCEEELSNGPESNENNFDIS